MQYFYSPSTTGFYVDVIHQTMPEDVFPVTEEEHAALMEGQSQGKVISLVSTAKLGLTDYVAPSKTWDDIRRKRDALLTASDWTQVPDNGLSDEVKAEWKVYRQKLRDVPDTFKTPDAVVWPATPEE